MEEQQSYFVVPYDTTNYYLTNLKLYRLQPFRLDIRPCPLTISSVYCLPRNVIPIVDYITFFQSLESRFLIGGDWNAKHTAWGARLITPKGRNLLAAISTTIASTSVLADLLTGPLTLTSCPTCWISLSLVACRQLISRWCPSSSYLLTTQRSLHPLELVFLTQRSLQRLPRPIPTGICFEPTLMNI